MANLLADEIDYDTYVTSDPKVALEWVEQDRIDCLFTDLKMKPMDGLDLLAEISTLDSNLPIIMMTGHATVDTAVEAMKKGAADYLQKPLEGDEFRAIVDRLADQVEDKRKLEGFQETQRSRETEKYKLIGNSDSIEELREKIKTVAPQPMSVLVKGETGTGKEIVARQIHAHSDRSDAPLMTVNCAAIPGNLLEEELFGHQKGAFTGADQTKKGKLELADSGTVFLDEIGELPIDLQPKLLRVLEQGEVTKVGGEFPRSVDVRFIAATNRNLHEMIQENTFRKDLYYRLNSFEIEAPSLRNHVEDVDELAEYFLQQMANKLSYRPSLSEEVLEELKNYSWPGNVRELRNVIERSAVLADNSEILIKDLPDEIHEDEVRQESSGKVNWKHFGDDLASALEQLEYNIISETLAEVDDNKAEAARRLGISRQSLQYKLDKQTED